MAKPYQNPLIFAVATCLLSQSALAQIYGGPIGTPGIQYESKLRSLSLAGEYAGIPFSRKKPETGGRGAFRVFRGRINLATLGQEQYAEGNLGSSGMGVFRQDHTRLPELILTPAALDVAMLSMYINDPESLQSIAAEYGSAFNVGIEVGKLIQRNFIASVESSFGHGVVSRTVLQPASVEIAGVIKIGNDRFLDVEIHYSKGINHPPERKGFVTNNDMLMGFGHPQLLTPVLLNTLYFDAETAAPYVSASYQEGLEQKNLERTSYRNFETPGTLRQFQASCTADVSERFRIRMDLESLRLRAADGETFFTDRDERWSRMGGWKMLLTSERRQTQYGISAEYDVLRLPGGSVLCVNGGVSTVRASGSRSGSLVRHDSGDMSQGDLKTEMNMHITEFNDQQGGPQTGRGTSFQLGVTYRFGKKNARFDANRLKRLEWIQQQNLLDASIETPPADTVVPVEPPADSAQPVAPATEPR